MGKIARYYTSYDMNGKERVICCKLILNNKDISTVLESLITLGCIENYTFFNGGMTKLKKKHFKKLKKIGLNAYIGISARIGMPELMGDFAATDEEIEVTDTIMKKYN